MVFWFVCCYSPKMPHMMLFYFINLFEEKFAIFLYSSKPSSNWNKDNLHLSWICDWQINIFITFGKYQSVKKDAELHTHNTHTHTYTSLPEKQADFVNVYCLMFNLLMPFRKSPWKIIYKVEKKWKIKWILLRKL